MAAKAAAAEAAERHAAQVDAARAAAAGQANEAVKAAQARVRGAQCDGLRLQGERDSLRAALQQVGGGFRAA